MVPSLLILTLIGWVSSASAQAKFDVVADKAVILEAPETGAKPLGYVRKGRSVRALETSGDFVKVRLRSGAFGWVKTADLAAGEAELEGEAPAGEGTAGVARDDDFKRWRLQIGLSSGSSGGRSYTEANLGVGYYFLRWLEFHNSLFASLDRVRNAYGLDSSLRGVLNTDLAGLVHLHAFAGPGYRFASDSAYNAVFAEAGLITSVAGFSLGGGLRRFFYKVKDAAAQDETQYFIILSGAARL